MTTDRRKLRILELSPTCHCLRLSCEEEEVVRVHRAAPMKGVRMVRGSSIGAHIGNELRGKKWEV